MIDFNCKDINREEDLDVSTVDDKGNPYTISCYNYKGIFQFKVIPYEDHFEIYVVDSSSNLSSLLNDKKFKKTLKSLHKVSYDFDVDSILKVFKKIAEYLGK